MVEILTVIGILAILAGLIAVGFNVLNSSQERRTRVALESAMGMLAEYENATPLTGAYKTHAVDVDNGEPAIYEATVATVNKLLKVPNNKSAVEKVDASNLTSLSYTFAANSTFNNTPSSVTLTEPLLMDGWQKALLYVGSGGLVDVTSEATGTTKRTIKAPNGRPFWVSAGQDGSFQTHDDNVYSFEN